MYERKRVKKVFTKPSLTRQEFKEECDLGKVIKRFARTAEGREALKNAQGCVGGTFGDFSRVPDFRAARQAVMQANDSFMKLPAVVRRRFDNDPAMFLDFCSDSKNLPELRSLGLAVPEVTNPVKGGLPVPAAG